MSHAAIVSPRVWAAGGGRHRPATAQIKTGQRIRVYGTNGTVTILDSRP